MKINSNLKTAFSRTIFIAAILFAVFSCNRNRKPEDTKDVAEEHNDGKFDNSKQEKDAKFIVNAAEINMEEIQLGRLAQNSSSLHVKELGKLMVNAHTKLLDSLEALAKKKVITLPTSATDKGQNAYKKLNSKSGNDFDKQYADLTVNGHKNVIAMFEKASSEGRDPDIKNWAITTLPELRALLDRSIDCQKICDKPLTTGSR